MSALNKQIGGDHYKNDGIQPLELVEMKYGLIGLEASVYVKVNKYFRNKGDNKKKLEDFKKARHCLDILIERYENNGEKSELERYGDDVKNLDSDSQVNSIDHNGRSFVRISSVPGFEEWLVGSAKPIVEGQEDPHDWAYSSDYMAFIRSLDCSEDC